MEYQKFKDFFTSIRANVLIGGFLVAVGVFAYVQLSVVAPTAVITKLQQSYGLIAFGLLYLTMLISPLTLAFPTIPHAGKMKRARRATGQLVFFFGVLHSIISFFWQLGGFDGLQYLGGTYQLAISLSFTALCILFLMTITSFDAAVARLTHRWWKSLHRLVYLAAVLILAHAWLLGSHFADRYGPFINFIYVALAFLLCLEAYRFDTYLNEKNIYTGSLRIFFTLTTGLFLAFFVWLSWVHGSALLGELM